MRDDEIKMSEGALFNIQTKTVRGAPPILHVSGADCIEPNRNRSDMILSDREQTNFSQPAFGCHREPLHRDALHLGGEAEAHQLGGEPLLRYGPPPRGRISRADPLSSEDRGQSEGAWHAPLFQLDCRQPSQPAFPEADARSGCARRKR